jgi:hypothetical protein
MPLITTQSARGYGWGALSGPQYENSWESIATYSSGATGTITFNSVPSTFKHLRLIVRLRDSRSGVAYSSANLTFNGSTTGYAYTWLYADNRGTIFDDSSSGSSAIALSIPGAAASNVYGYSIIDIYDYTDTSKFTGVQGISGFVDPTTGIGGQCAVDVNGTWALNSVVNTISIAASNPNFASNVRASLYGMKG